MVEAIRQGDIPGVQLRVRQPIAATIEETWRWLGDPEAWPRWICDRVAAGERVSEARWVVDEPAGEPVVEIVTITRSESPLLLEAALRRPDWNAATHLSFEVTRGVPGDAATAELSILHRHFERLPLSVGLTIWEHYRRRWRRAAEKLARVIGRGEPT